jgi:hypothetical protein
MKTAALCRITMVTVVSFISGTCLLAQDQNLNDWLNTRINGKVQAQVDQRSNAKQTEAPSQGSNSTSLVDQTSASDLVSMALSLAGVSGNSTDNSSPKSLSVTASAYSLYALFKQQDPLDAQFYNNNARWRRLSLTLGYDNDQTQSGNSSHATIAGAKLLIVNNRDLSSCGNHSIGSIKSTGRCKSQQKLFDSLKIASISFGQIELQVQLYLMKRDDVAATLTTPEWRGFLESNRSGPDSGMVSQLETDSVKDLFGSDRSKWTRLEKMFFVEFANKHFDKAGFPAILSLIGKDGIAQIDSIVAGQAQAFLDLSDSGTQALEALRTAPQFSVAFTSTTRPGTGANQYVAETIFDYGVVKRINLSLNNTFTYKDAKTLGGITRGSKFVGDLQFQLTKEKRLTGRDPITFDVGGEGDWMTKTSPTYKGQVKVNIPIVDGITLPVSITFSNRTDLIKERDVIGKFGFTFDTTKLLSLFAKSK